MNSGIEKVQSMKLTVLIDNQTLIDRYYRGEPGVSYWVETEGMKILFDTGYSELFLENGRKMGIEPTQADFVVLSHGHNDHSWGLAALVRSMTERQTELHQQHRPILIAHPGALLPKRVADLDIGTQLSAETLGRHMGLQLGKEAQRLTEKLIWLGEIPRVHSFEPEHSIGEACTDGCWQPDLLADDTALAYCSGEGLVIITGCSHAGICNIVTHAQHVTGEKRVAAVIGGFHLLKPDPERLDATIAFFQQAGVTALHAGHCTGFEARAALARELCQQEIGVGTVLTF